MNNFIAESSANFGYSPRSFSVFDRMGYLRVKKPKWLKDDPEDKMNLFFDHLSAVFKNGKVVWGHVIQANSTLFEVGTNDAPGELVYSLQDSRNCSDFLPIVAQDLFSLKGTNPSNPELAPIANYLTDQFIRVYGLDVPRCVSSRIDCKISTTLFVRKHLPGGRLCRNLLPIVVLEDTPMVAAPLPLRYWSVPLLNWWLASS